MGHHWTDYYTEEQLAARKAPYKRRDELIAAGWWQVGDFEDRLYTCPICYCVVHDNGNNPQQHMRRH